MRRCDQPWFFPVLDLKGVHVMSMNTFEACAVIAKFRENAIVVNTMSAMFAISAISPSPLNLASVPLMGGASGLALGLAIAQPDKQVFVLDGDASLLMELGTLAEIADEAPANMIHFVFNNAVQFGGVANLDRPGRRGFDFCAIALGAGYASARKVSSMPELIGAMPELMAQDGPHFVELDIAAPPKFTVETPQPEMPDLQFGRMAAESAAMMDSLGTTR